MNRYQIVSEHDGNESFTVEAVNAEAAALEALGVLGWSLCAPSPTAGARQIGLSHNGRAVWQRESAPPFIVLYNARGEPSCHEVQPSDFTQSI